MKKQKQKLTDEELGYSETVGRAKVRRMISCEMLKAIIQSAPMCDRTEVNTDKWAKKAIEFTDSLMKGLEK